MHAATMTSKGQVTIPKAVRERLGIATGSQLRFRLNTAGETVVEVLPVDLMSLCGVIPWSGPPVTDAELEAGIAAAVAEDFRANDPADSA